MGQVAYSELTLYILLLLRNEKKLSLLNVNSNKYYEPSTAVGLKKIYILCSFHGAAKMLKL